MRLVLGSDLHGYLPDVLPCDVLVLAGDILPEKDQEVFIHNKLKPWLLLAPAGAIVATWGNHDDRPFRYHYALPWNLLLDASVSIQGLKFHGTPWSLPVGRWAWQAPEYVLEMIYKMIPDDVDVLISHAPPYGICDRTDPVPEKQRPSENVGSRELRKRMDELSRLKLLVCGHIHEGHGQGGKVINASCLNRQYQLRKDPWTMVEL